MFERHVVLVSPEIHWNTGNIGRTCVATGSYLHLIRPLGFSLDSKEVRRAGLDYWKQVKLKVWDNFDALASKLAPDRNEVALFSKTGLQPFTPAALSDFRLRNPGAARNYSRPVSGGHLSYPHLQKYPIIESFHGSRYCPL